MRQQSTLINDLPDWVWEYVPHWVTVSLVALALLAFTLMKLASSREGIEQLWSRLSRWLHSSRDNEIRNRDVDYQIADLWRQVQFLEEQLAELRLRDEMYWAWILSDQEWHRQYEFHAAQKGFDIIPHVSFMDFRDEWLLQRQQQRNNQSGESPF